MKREEKLVIGFFATWAVFFIASACGPAQGGSTPTVIQVYAPDQSLCYVVMQGATAVGGNCR